VLPTSIRTTSTCSSCGAGIFGLIAFFAFIGAALLDRGDGTRARVVAVALLLAWCATSVAQFAFQDLFRGPSADTVLGAMLARTGAGP